MLLGAVLAVHGGLCGAQPIAVKGGGVAKVKATDPVRRSTPPARGESADPFAAFAEELAAGLDTGKDGTVNVGVGNFTFENTDLLSPFSSLLREEMEIALGKTGRLRVVTRDRIADLQLEGRFQNKEILEPGTGVEKVSVQGVKGIVRGRFFISASQITVFAELVWLEGGAVQKARLAIPTTQVRAKLWPDPVRAALGDVAQVAKPSNIERSLANVQEMAGGRLAQVPKDFDVQVFTVDGKRAYAAGETVGFRVRAARECHVAVLCHSSDGTSVVLFPNRWADNTLIPAGETIEVPGARASGFQIQIGAPFGSDVVEVIACSQPSELHRALSRAAMTPDPGGRNFSSMPRGMLIKGLSAALVQPASATDGVPLQWGRDSMVVSTFPKP